jgi:peroxiredoxin
VKRFLLITSWLLTLPALGLAGPRPPVSGGDENDAVRAGAVEPPVTLLSPGDRAPDFSFDTVDSTLHLHDVLAQGHALLVFQPDNDQLEALEADRAELERRAIFVIAVLDRGERATRTLERRLHLHYLVISDNRGVIAGQFNVLGATTRRPEPAWFAIDHRGKIRGLERTRVPDAGYVDLATSALHLPAPDAIAPSSAH